MFLRAAELSPIELDAWISGGEDTDLTWLDPLCGDDSSLGDALFGADAERFELDLRVRGGGVPF